MAEEFFVPRAQIVEAALTVGGVEKTAFRALAVTGETHIALPAVTRQRGQLFLAKFLLLGRIDQRGKRTLHDVA